MDFAAAKARTSIFLTKFSASAAGCVARSICLADTQTGCGHYSFIYARGSMPLTSIEKLAVTAYDILVAADGYPFCQARCLLLCDQTTPDAETYGW
jgi:hypothetical protein